MSPKARVSGAPVPEDWPIAMRLARLTQRKEFLAAADHGRRFRSSAFMAQVRDAERTGYGVDRGTLYPGINSIGVIIISGVVINRKKSEPNTLH